MADFYPALQIVLRHEGGLGNVSGDRGGLTKYGISHAAYPHLDIPHLTISQATEIYHDDYWTKYHIGDITDQGVANFIFDMLVNMGPYHDFQIVQRACNECGEDVMVDGHVGPKTIAAINAADPCKLKQALAGEAEKFYKELNQPKFLTGWLARVADDLKTMC